MSTTTNVVDKGWFATYRRHGYYFREAAMLTIGLGVLMHLYRVIYGDELTLRYIVTPTTDKILMVPMTYAAITGIALLMRHRIRFANRLHRTFFTASVVYIAASVPLHVYCSYVINDVGLFTSFEVWFSYTLLCLVYPAFLTMFWRLQYRD